MPLQQADIRFARSAVMADVPEGGGPPTAQLLPDGASNAIWPDVREEDRAIGKAEIRQFHTVLRNTDRAPLLGGNVILAEPPNDPNVDVVLMTTRDPFATRTQIVEQIESSMSASVEFAGYLLENHAATQRSLQIFQRPGAEPPGIGRVYLLVQNEGQPSEKRQRVRIKNVDVQQRMVSAIVNGQLVDFMAQITTAELFDPLRYAFAGSPVRREFARLDDTKTVIRETVYSDSGMFYGAGKLTAIAQATDTLLQLDTVHARLVPNSRTESISVDQRPAAQRTVVLAESPRRIEVGVTPHTQRVKVTEANQGLAYVFQCRPLPAPGTVVLQYWSMGQRYTVADDGAGSLTGSGAGIMSYFTGVVPVTLAALPDIGTIITCSWGESVGYTDRSGQSLQVRPPEFAWVLDGEGAVVPGTASFTWTSAGVTKNAAADANGVISGDATGFVDAASRRVQLKPVAMPDAGAQIQCAYQLDSVTTEIIPAPGPDAGGFIAFNLAAHPVAGSVKISWVTAQEVSKTSGGFVSRQSTAKNNSTQNSVVNMPKSEFDAQVDQTGVTALHTGSSDSPGGPGIDYGSGGTQGLTPYKPVQVTTERSASQRSTYTQQSTQDSATRLLTLHTVTDDAAGGFMGGLSGMGTVVYGSGAVSLRVVRFGRSASSYKADYESASEFNAVANNGQPSSGSGSELRGGDYGTTTLGESVIAGSSLVATYRTGAAAPVAATMSYTPPMVVIDLCPATSDSIVPGSVRFTWMGHTYEDFDGVIYRGRTAVAPGTPSGTINPAAGLVTLTDYVVGGSPGTVSLQSLWTRRSPWRTASLFFNTTSAPLRPGAGGFVLSVVDVQGSVLTANINAQGDISGPHVIGKVQFSTGSVEMQFGDFVNDADLSPAEKAEWWYSAADVGAVQAGKIWRPWPVDPTTLRYSTVSFIYLPIDADLLGLDPTALPADGRVAIFRPGELLVAAKGSTSAAITPSLPYTYNTGTPMQSLIRVVGVDGTVVEDGYTVNLNAGTVTFTDVTGWPAQVRVHARQEVYRRIAEVRVDGKLRLTQPLGVALPVGAIISSALRQGDLFSRVKRVYDQQTWDGVSWVDGLDGSSAVGTYNTTANPVEINNLGGITERWALRFRSDGTTFDLIGQHLGQVATGTRNADFIPINPASGAPYFVLREAGWGAGWVAGNTLFIDTVGASFPIDAIRTVQPGSAPGGDYSCLFEQRGDVDTPPANPFE